MAVLVITLFVCFVATKTTVMGQQSQLEQQEYSSVERAQCQCSVDGFSNERNVLYNSNTGRIYKSENTATGGPYKFIGCGAHTRYRDNLEGQIGGYPWKFCYTYGGLDGCSITELSQKHSLNDLIAYRFCNGDYDCNAKARVRVSDNAVEESLLDTINLREVDHDGLLQDWTNCCQECRRYGTDCRFWDFSVETMKCRLFSHVGENTETLSDDEAPSSPPMWYFGEPGFDDKPLHCWHRNRYDTCSMRAPRFLLIFGIIAIILSTILFFVIRKCTDRTEFKLASTNDVTPGYSRTSNRRVSSGKGGGSHLKQVTVYNASIRTVTNGVEKQRHVQREGQRFLPNQTLYYKYQETNPGEISLLNCCDRCCFGCKYMCPSLIAAAGFSCLAVLCIQVFTTDGGRISAQHVLPGEGRKGTWGFFMIICPLAFLLLATAWCYDLCRRRTVQAQDKYDRLAQKEGKSDKEVSTDKL